MAVSTSAAAVTICTSRAGGVRPAWRTTPQHGAAIPGVCNKLKTLKDYWVSLRGRSHERQLKPARVSETKCWCPDLLEMRRQSGLELAPKCTKAAGPSETTANKQSICQPQDHSRAAGGLVQVPVGSGLL